MKFSAPTNPDDALTILVNDQSAYKVLLPAVKLFAAGSEDYTRLRDYVYRACKIVFDNYGSKDQALTSKLVPRVCERYWEEAAKREWTEKDAQVLYKITPDWAREQLDYKPKETTVAKSENLEFRVGDKVKIVKSIPDTPVGWNEDMNAYVNDGVVYTVASVYSESVRFKAPGNKWAWPKEALELVVDPLTTAAKTLKEPAVSNPKAPVEHITFIFGVPRKDVSDDAIFEHIRTLENQIKDLEKIDNKPKKLKDKIKSLKNSIDDLIKLVDGDGETKAE